MTLRIPPQEPSFVLDARAHKLTQGLRTVYYSALRVGQFDDSLPEQVDKEVIRDNRRFIASHAAAITDYLRDTDTWVLGPVTLSIDPRYVEFTPFEGQAETDVPVLGNLRIHEGGRTALRILDGQHRRAAIRDFRNITPATEDEARRLRAFETSLMPIALYEETSPDAIRQMFADMAKQRNMDQVTRARFDRRDPFNRAAEEVMEHSVWLGPFVETDRSNVARTSAKLIAFNQLAVNLKAIEYGYGGRVSRIRQQETSQNFDAVVERGLSWVDDFLPAARLEYQRLTDFDQDDDFLPQQRRKTFAYSGTMLRILAGCVFEWRRQNGARDIAPLAAFVRSMNFETGQESGLLLSSGVVDTEGFTLRGGRREIGTTIEGIVRGAEALTA